MGEWKTVRPLFLPLLLSGKHFGGFNYELNTGLFIHLCPPTHPTPQMENWVHTLQPPQVRTIYWQITLVTDFFSGCYVRTDDGKRGFFPQLLVHILISSYLRGFDLHIVYDCLWQVASAALSDSFSISLTCGVIGVREFPHLQPKLHSVPAKGPQCNRVFPNTPEHANRCESDSSSPHLRFFLEHKYYAGWADFCRGCSCVPPAGWR